MAALTTYAPRPPSPIAPELIIVIPCHDEPDLTTTLDSLWQCQRPPGGVEVITVINGAATDPPELKKRNQLTQEQGLAWATTHRDPQLRFDFRHEPTLPPKHAGVGLGRKIGMDRAAQRFFDHGKPQGVIVCLDADCRVAPNYLTHLFHHFQTHPDSPGCAIHFEHPLAGLTARARQGIVDYELFLRYYRQGLQWSGFPHAFHTVGSSMAVRAVTYRRQGGMNRRKAGEDFYFLQKIIPLGGFTALCSTTVFPSPRASHRVPFGTGRAMATWLAGAAAGLPSYDPRVFQDLRCFFSDIKAYSLNLGPNQKLLQTQAPPLATFLKERSATEKLAEIQANTASPSAFQKRFFQWFNAFMILKYVHWATAQAYPRIPVAQGASILLQWMKKTIPNPDTLQTLELLNGYRALDRDNC